MKGKLLPCLLVIAIFIFAGCSKNEKTSAIELMGAGDRIHDTYTFANNGVKINHSDNNYVISGSVDKLTDENVKSEFDIENTVSHVVAIKLTAVDSKVVKDEVEIQVDGSRAYDAEHLNGENYTFIILEAVPGQSVSVVAKWSNSDEEKTYIVRFAEDLNLK